MVATSKVLPLSRNIRPVACKLTLYIQDASMQNLYNNQRPIQNPCGNLLWTHHIQILFLKHMKIASIATNATLHVK